MKTLKPPQVKHVQRLLGVLEYQNAACDLSPCGLGKTVVAAEVARTLRRPFFVVAPLSTLPAWEKELADRNVTGATVTNYESLRAKKGKQWVDKDRFGRWKWSLPADTLLCLDEAQALKGSSSIISRIAIASKPYTKLLLSGSMAENPAQMRATGFLLGLHDLRSYYHWAKTNGCRVDCWGKLVFNNNQKILDAIHNELIPVHGSRMTYEEMKAFLPDNQVFYEEVDFGGKGALAAIYEEMEADLAILELTAKSDSKGAEMLTARLRARQKAELLKIPVLVERAEDLVAEGNSVVVFLAFNASLAAFSERLGGVPCISGAHGDRQRVIDDFQADRSPVIGVNIAAGGVGISLHGKRPRRTILTPDDNPVTLFQALGRAPRVGGSDVIQFVLSGAGTVEEIVAMNVRRKMKNIGIVNAGIIDEPNKIDDNEKTNGTR